MSRDIPIDLIDPDPEQPRRHFDEARLDELAQSMRANGLLQPILVRPVEGDRFMIVHGERRWRAAQLLDWLAVPAEVRDMTAEEARLLALIENVQRADLSPVEEARAYQAHLAGGITQAALGEQIGKSQSYIAGKLRLLTLSDKLQGELSSGRISEGHAKQLLRLNGPEEVDRLCDRIVAEGWTVRQTNRKVDAATILEPHSKATFNEAAAWLKENEEAADGGVMAEEYVRMAFLVGDMLNAAERWWHTGAPWVAINVLEKEPISLFRTLQSFEDLDAGLSVPHYVLMGAVPEEMRATIDQGATQECLSGLTTEQMRELAEARVLPADWSTKITLAVVRQSFDYHVKNGTWPLEGDPDPETLHSKYVP